MMDEHDADATIYTRYTFDDSRLSLPTSFHFYLRRISASIFSLADVSLTRTTEDKTYQNASPLIIILPLRYHWPRRHAFRHFLA